MSKIVRPVVLIKPEVLRAVEPMVVIWVDDELSTAKTRSEVLHMISRRACQSPRLYQSGGWRASLTIAELGKWGSLPSKSEPDVVSHDFGARQQRHRTSDL